MATPVSIATPSRGTIRLTMTAKVANDLGALQKGLKSLAERMGHPGCATGCDILHLQTEREFTLGADVSLNPQPLPPRQAGSDIALPQDPIPLRTVNVVAPDSVLGNITQLTKATAAVLGKLGCGQCCSGFDILFRRELGMLAIDEKLKVQGFGQFR